MKNSAIHHPPRSRFRAECFNLLDHPAFPAHNLELISQSFGTIMRSPMNGERIALARVVSGVR